VSDDTSESRQEQPTSSEPTKKTHTIFIVEDDAAVRGLVHEILEHYGYRVIEAPTGDGALAMWPAIREEVDLLLTDMVMPGEHNGLDLARKLLADRPELPVIYTSGYSRELFSGKIGLQEGRNYLPKPYLTAKLLAIIQNALESRVPRT
jgi:two-component system, cell cycle sensor histidine kinase and response regulator CckA